MGLEIRRHLVAAARTSLIRTGLDERVFAANLRRRFGRQPVVVYSMPKVGSTAMLHATRATGRQAIPVHNLSAAARAREAARAARTAPSEPDTKPWRSGYGGVWRSNWVAARLQAPTAQPWEIITGVREPVARSISAFFHAGERNHNIDPGTPPEEVDLPALQDRWVDAYWRASRRDWFHEELFAMAGVDVYARPFPLDIGHDTYESATARVLLIRNEDIGRAGPDALSQFLDLPVATPPPINRASDKNYAGIYQRFITEVRVPADVLDHAYASRVARHFYTDEELNRFRIRWTGE